MRAIERLKAAVSMAQAKKSVTLPDGSEFEWYMSPLTIAQRTRAQKAAGSDDAIAFSLQLLQMVAKDENGAPLFAAGDMAELRNALPAKLVDDLLLVMLDAKEGDEDEEGEEEEEVTPKTSRRRSRKTTS